MHGTYEHRITCNLHTEDFTVLCTAAEAAGMTPARYAAEAAVAYARNRHVIPTRFVLELQRRYQNIVRTEIKLSRISFRTKSLRRITHRDMEQAGRLAIRMEEDTRAIRNILKQLAQAQDREA